jgi:hypothetical protein
LCTGTAPELRALGSDDRRAACHATADPEWSAGATTEAVS